MYHHVSRTSSLFLFCTGITTSIWKIAPPTAYISDSTPKYSCQEWKRKTSRHFSFAEFSNHSVYICRAFQKKKKQKKKTVTSRLRSFFTPHYVCPALISFNGASISVMCCFKRCRQLRRQFVFQNAALSALRYEEQPGELRRALEAGHTKERVNLWGSCLWWQ